jgi:hypothetical protein
VLELSRPSLHVIRCCARPSVIDGLSLRRDSGRIAADEILVLVTTSDALRVLAEVVAEVEASNATGIVIDHSDAFLIASLSGLFRQALARLSALELPETGFVQGLVAGVPCKVFVAPDRVHLLAPSTYAHYVRERIFAACSDLGVREGSTSETQSLGPVATV